MADDVKAAFGEALAGALTLAGGHAAHPTEIVIDPESVSRNRQTHTIIPISERCTFPLLMKGSVDQHGDWAFRPN